ncbi:MAG: hypothetical protein EAX90_10780, partial [Candidatus Heimdallarchaeota archaeon]|nr:hypothetical protein [Candidatus Heimdallarchaeota archaeon]
MNLDFPLTPEKIREGMNEIISEIRKETNWDLMRNLSDITITIGDAPEYFESFGVSRSSQDLIFGEWLEKLEPDYTKESLVEYLIIRESFSLFFKESLLFSEIRMLTDFFLNILTVSFIKNKFEGRSFDIVVGFAKARFLFKKNDITNFDIQFLIKMDELVTSIINQGISYTLIFNTYLFFIEDIPFNEINIDEVLIDFSRYLAVSSLEIAAPIQFNESIIKTLEKLVELGYQTSIT